jgi:hypothetical protein
VGTGFRIGHAQTEKLQKIPVKRRTRARQNGVTNGRTLVTAIVFSVL